MNKAQFEARRSEVHMIAFADASIAGLAFMACANAADAALDEFEAAYAADTSNAKSDFYTACADAFTGPSGILAGMGVENDESPAYYKRAAAVVRAKFAAYLSA